MAMKSALGRKLQKAADRPGIRVHNSNVIWHLGEVPKGYLDEETGLYYQPANVKKFRKRRKTKQREIEI